jgi:hypothetical protein
MLKCVIDPESHRMYVDNFPLAKIFYFISRDLGYKMADIVREGC